MLLAAVLVSTNGPWFCGDSLSIADLKSYVVVTGLENGTYAAGIEKSVIDASPGIL